MNRPYSKFNGASWRLVVMLMVTFALSACVVPDALTVKPPASNAPVPAALDTPATVSPHLEKALAYAPSGTDYFAFTDWSVIREVAGVTDLTSADTLDERMDFLRPLGVEEQALAAGFGINYFFTHAETWGWDSTDLLWESNLTTEGPPLFVLRFREDFDFAPVFARLDERGYSKSEATGAILYSHEMELGAEWMGTTEFAILNIGYVETEKLFVLSSSSENVTTALDAIAQGSTLASLPGVYSVAAELGHAGAVLLSPMGCQLLDPVAMLDSSPAVEELLEGLDRSGIRGSYSIFGLGYRVERGDGRPLPLGILVHHYLLAEQANADLAPRRRVAEKASSLATSAPYSDLFEVVDAQVVEIEGSDPGAGGANLVLALHALERSPQLFFDMFYRRDMLFSVCGSS